MKDGITAGLTCVFALALLAAAPARTENRYGYTGIKIGQSYYVPKGVWPIYSDCIIIIHGDESDESLPVWSSIDTGLRIEVV
jgi:hypothetical protein